MSGSCVWYSATSAGDKLRLRAYSTTSSFLLAQRKYPERRTLVTLLYRPVERFQVELQLPQVLRAERVDLEFNRHQAVQTAVEKQQIERKILSADLQRVFRTHKAETRPSSMRKSRNLSSSARCRSASA